MLTIINENYEGLEYLNGRYTYNGDLFVDGNAVIEIDDIFIDGNLDVRGNLTTKDVKVSGCIAVGGDFVAGNVECKTAAIERSMTVNGDFKSEMFWINGDLAVSGDTEAKNGVSTVFDRLTTTNLVIDRLYVGGDIDVKGKIYTSMQGGILK